MKKRILAWICCLLLVTQMAVPPARAEKSVYFVAAGSNVLPLSDATMPFWSGGYLYVASTIFTGIVWNALGISYVPANAKQPLILYSGDDKSLLFDLSNNFAQDLAGDTYFPGAVQRNGIVFVPAALVASFFGLQYSLINNVDHGSLVWLRKPGFGLGDQDFANAATYSMNASYAQYMKSKEPVVETPPEEKPPETPPEEPEINKGQSIYLCLQADSTARAMLDVLDREGIRAAFFCSQEFLESEGDLLRRMTAEGHTIGLLADASSTKQTVEEQLQRGNELLWKATFTKTRFARVKGDDAARQAAETAGFYCLTPNLDRTGYSLRSSSHADALLQKIASGRGSVVVWLGNTANSTGLRAFLTAAKKADDYCVPLRETV